MLPSDPQPLQYQSPGPAGAAAPRLWVVCLLLLIQLVGAIAGRNLWPFLYRGKDPQIEFAWANGVGFVVLAAMCWIFSKRLSRLRLFDALLAFALGALSSVVGMGWGILNGYGQ